jgi:DNA transformation protein and related proteins
VIEQLDGLARVAVRRLFGGVGLYNGRHLFAIVYRGALYLRADDGLRRDLARGGGGPFRPYRGRVVTGFWEVPAPLAAEKRRLRALARRALSIGDEAARRALAGLARRRFARVKLAPTVARRPPGRR